MSFVSYNKVDNPRVVIFEVPESALDDGAEGHNWALEYYEEEYISVRDTPTLEIELEQVKFVYDYDNRKTVKTRN